MLQANCHNLRRRNPGGAGGYFGQCSSGACPLTANWRRGALYGAFLGLMLALGQYS